MKRTFERIAIVNRGIPATRGLAAARDLGRQEDKPLRTIAFYTKVDRDAPFVQGADEAWSLGESTFTSPRDGVRRSAYLDLDHLREGLKKTRAEAAWVGWGSLAEHAPFAELCRELGVLFIGPSSQVLALVGDKIATKRLAEQAGVPVVSWYGGPVETLSAAEAYASRVGFPLLAKGSIGDGARAVRRVSSIDELGEAVAAVRTEARAKFGDERVLLERMLTSARHIEVPVVADSRGTVWAFTPRDGTAQRSHRLVLVETPARSLTSEEDGQARTIATRMVHALGFAGVGTVELLFNPEDRSFSFVEINPCLSPEHTLTEATTGLDLGVLQLKLARGDELHGTLPPSSRGHAIGVRVRAEDPTSEFRPAAREIEHLRLPQGAGLRVDAGYEQGDTISPELDTTVAEIVATGRDRDEARARLLRALEDTLIVLQGSASDRGFLLEILTRPEVLEDRVDVTWLDRLVSAGEHLIARGAEIALLFAGVLACEDEISVEKRHFLETARRGRPVSGHVAAHRAELAYAGQKYVLRVAKLGPHRYRIGLGADGAVIDVGLETITSAVHRILIGDRRFRVVVTADGENGHVIEIDGIAHRVERSGGAFVPAPAPAVVASIPVKPGDLVKAGDPVAVLEAMKTELTITASESGRVREVLVRPYAHVVAGAPLIVLESSGSGLPRRASAIGLVKLSHLATPAEVAGEDVASWWRHLDELRSLVLGYDVDVARLKKAPTWSGAGTPRQIAETCAGEDDVLALFVDQLALFHGVTVDEPDDDDVDARMSRKEYLLTFLRDPSCAPVLPPRFVEALRRSLARYGVHDLERGPALATALFRMFRSYERRAEQTPLIVNLLLRRIDCQHTADLAPPSSPPSSLSPASDTERFLRILESLVVLTSGEATALHDAALEARFVFVERPMLETSRAGERARAERALGAISSGAPASEHVDALVACEQPLTAFLVNQLTVANVAAQRAMAEVLFRRYYRARQVRDVSISEIDGVHVVAGETHQGDSRSERVLLAMTRFADVPRVVAALARRAAKDATPVVLEVHASRSLEQVRARADEERSVTEILKESRLPAVVRRVTVTLSSEAERSPMRCFTFVSDGGAITAEDARLRDLHPMLAERLHLWRLSTFDLERLPSHPEVFLFRATAKENKKDDRLIALAEVRDLSPVKDKSGKIIALPHMERLVLEAVAGMRDFQSRRAPRDRLQWNRIQLFVWPPLRLAPDEIQSMAHRLGPATEGLGMDRVVVTARVPAENGELVSRTFDFYSVGGRGIAIKARETPTSPMRTLGAYSQKVARLQQQGLMHPWELISMIAPPRSEVRGDFPPGELIEHDLAPDGVTLVPVDRPRAQNEANIIVGTIRSFTPKHPEGMLRVVLLGDPSKDMGALAEPECRRIEAAIGLAHKLDVPLEWYALSAGARISMASGTENMDWIALVLRRLIEHTQRGGEVNIIVDGINVGAQPYWNAEATMLGHTRGILVMTARGAMVLTGKRALDFSGGVSADDNSGIGGYERVMGPNGQAQYYAEDLSGACKILYRHYDHTYRTPGERFPRRATTTDPVTRDVREFPYNAAQTTSAASSSNSEVVFTRVGDIFSEEHNPGRKKPFDIRAVLRAAIDTDSEPLERWGGQRDAENAVVWDAHIGGYPVCLLGIESRPLPRLGFVAADGPTTFTGGTLFPLASKKISRAINAASDNRPLVVLANLSGFDGSPESMRNLQLEYGAEIGRAVVNFKGPIVFSVISRYHGGAFVVFSRRLSDNMEVVALEGTYASVIGGAPAAAVVFAREVDRRAKADARLAALEAEIGKAQGVERLKLRAEYEALYVAVHTETLGVVAREFDGIHSVERAARVGSVDRIIAARDLRPYLVDAIERGMRREQERIGRSARVS